MNPQEINILEEDCFNRHILDIVINKWTSLIFYALSQGPRRYNQLKKLIEGISQTMLTSTLRKLERNGLVHRQIYPVIPPKVEYSLTPLGETLIPIFEQIYQWTGTHVAEIEIAQKEYDEQNPSILSAIE
jgi:DNA-binding HxlR family transcriptional regulator